MIIARSVENSTVMHKMGKKLVTCGCPRVLRVRSVTIQKLNNTLMIAKQAGEGGNVLIFAFVLPRNETKHLE